MLYPQRYFRTAIIDRYSVRIVAIIWLPTVQFWKVANSIIWSLLAAILGDKSITLRKELLEKLKGSLTNTNIYNHLALSTIDNDLGMQ